jgi:F0F1-type ATP synthase assembly protein I
VSDERRRQAQAFRRIADASAMGLAFPIAIAIGYFWGRELDRYLGTAPWLTYVFTGFGVGAGFLNAIRVALRVGREEDQSDPRGGGA